MRVKFKRTSSNAIAPKQAHSGDAGFDLFAISDCEIPPGDSKLLPTGISIELPEGTEAQVRPRSGLALKHQITVLNSPGTIDCSYRGDVGVILFNHGKSSFVVKAGDRIAQLVVKPVLSVAFVESEELGDTSRGDGGFGSTGK